MGTFGLLGQMKLRGELKPSKDPLPKGKERGKAMWTPEPLHVHALHEEERKARTFRGCAGCGHGMKGHDRLGCTEDGCECRRFKMRLKKKRSTNQRRENV